MAISAPLLVILRERSDRRILVVPRDIGRFFAEFTLSVDSSVTSFLQNGINEVLRMTESEGLA
jgi:hypothetical protein